MVADICISSYRYQIIQKKIQRNIKIHVQEIVQYFNMILDKLIFFYYPLSDFSFRGVLKALIFFPLRVRIFIKILSIAMLYIMEIMIGCGVFIILPNSSFLRLPFLIGCGSDTLNSFWLSERGFDSMMSTCSLKKSTSSFVDGDVGSWWLSICNCRKKNQISRYSLKNDIKIFVDHWNVLFAL